MNKLNINCFFEGLAAALTVQYSKEYPGLQVTVKNICLKENGVENKVVSERSG